MPTFESNPLENLAISPDTIDETIELGDADPQLALARVRQLLAEAPTGRCYQLTFDPARGDGAETLFLPLGRYLLDARREGLLTRCLPIGDGSGFVITVGDRKTWTSSPPVL